MTIKEKDGKLTSKILWDFVDRDKMNDYVKSSDKIDMEDDFLKTFVKKFKYPIESISSVIRQTRSGLYFNIYEKRKQIGHASFHYDEGRPGSISHVVDDCYDARDDVEIDKDDKGLKFRLMGCIKDVYGFFSSMTSGLTSSFNGLLERRRDIAKDPLEYEYCE